MKDCQGTEIHLGDTLRCKWSYMVTVVEVPEIDYWVGKLICDPSHSCADIPYSLGNGEDYTVVERLFWTDYPLKDFGDVPGVPAPIRPCEMLSYDGDKYVTLWIAGDIFSIKLGYVYPVKRRGPASRDQFQEVLDYANALPKRA